MKKLLFTLLLSTTSFCSVWAQEGQDNEQRSKQPAPPTQGREERKGGPDKLKAMAEETPNYGSLVIDYGFHSLYNCPKAMNMDFWRSRFANVYLYYNIRLGHSHFTISPGVGVGFDGYQFKEQDKQYNTFVRNEDTRHTAFKDARELFPKSDKLLQSGLDMRYLDFMLEVRFSANRKYPKEGFFVALGGKLGILLRASTTIKYQEDDQHKQRTEVDSFNLNQMRYGIHARVGWERFSLFYTQTLSHLFNEHKGPDKTTTRPWGIGLSVDLF